jgi:two-component system, OmpR family, flagellar system response regulator FtcR
MIILVEDRMEVGDAFMSGFRREGVASALIGSEEIVDWFSTASAPDVGAVEGILLGSVEQGGLLLKPLRERCSRPLIVLSERRSLDETLLLLGLGADDVLAKPVHVRELLARFRVIAARRKPLSAVAAADDIILYVDGRDPIVAGQPLQLPRRERRILECLAGARGAWLTKAQIFSHVYGIFNEEFDEIVVESHVSRLRKRLRTRLGREAIESQRFLGYRILSAAACGLTEKVSPAASLEQGTYGDLGMVVLGATGADDEFLRDYGNEYIRHGSSG